jgi:hypothetical protein
LLRRFFPAGGEVWIGARPCVEGDDDDTVKAAAISGDELWQYGLDELDDCAPSRGGWGDFQCGGFALGAIIHVWVSRAPSGDYRLARIDYDYIHGCD